MSMPQAARHVRSRLPRLATACLCALALAACNVDLYTNLEQQEANNIVATLARHGIPAGRVAGKEGRLTVTVDERAFAEAMRILEESGLPKQDFKTLGEVFKKDGLVSSPVQERAQMIFALSQELERTISGIDGVLSARVHLVLPENDPLRQQLIPSAASVLIRHRADMPTDNLVPQVRMLVANSVAGLSYDKVFVTPFPVETTDKADASDPGFESFMGVWVQRDSLSRVVMVFYGLVATVVLLAALLGIVLWRQRQRPYQLRPVKSP